MGEPLCDDALRSRLHVFFTTLSEPLPAAVVRLLSFDFGWSTFAGGALDGSVLDGTAVNGLDISAAGGLEELAVLLGGDDAVLFARSCAAPMSRPMVREEAFRSLFKWLQHECPTEFATAHYASLEQLMLAALTDTWSAVRKGSARALGGALVPLAAAQLHQLHFSMLALRLRLPPILPRHHHQRLCTTLSL